MSGTDLWGEPIPEPVLPDPFETYPGQISRELEYRREIQKRQRKARQKVEKIIGNPMILVSGEGPTGTHCRECVHFFALSYARDYCKCGLRHNTHGHDTDHHGKWPTCGKFEKRESGEYPRYFMPH
jgi:hypothetical protein